MRTTSSVVGRIANPPATNGIRPQPLAIRPTAHMARHRKRRTTRRPAQRADPRVVEAVGRLEGDLILLGVGGKMGPTLARMARRACDAAGVRRRVIGVSRFSSARRRAATRAARRRDDPLRPARPRPSSTGCPTRPTSSSWPGMKFGSTGQEAADLGDERLPAGHGLPAVRHEAGSSPFDRQRLRPVARSCAAARSRATRCGRSAITR